MSHRSKRFVQRFSTGSKSVAMSSSPPGVVTDIAGVTQCDGQWQQAAARMLEILRDNEIVTRDDKRALKQLLNQCHPSSDLLSYVDQRGYDVAQRGVLRNCVGFIEYMLFRGFKMHNVIVLAVNSECCWYSLGAFTLLACSK